MILKEFSKYLQNNKDKNSVLLLNDWLIESLKKPSLNKTDIILKTELYLLENDNKKTLVIAKSETGRNLIKALYNYAISYENYKTAKLMHDKK